MSRWQWLFFQLFISCFDMGWGEYLGCFRDSEDRLMKGYVQNFVLTLTPDRCVDLCTTKGFKFAGLKARINCFCDQRAPPQRSEEVLCQGTCVGDNTKICGGNEALSVYSTKLAQKEETREPVVDSFIGCYKDNTNARLLPSHFQELITNNSPERCKAICHRLGFLYAGVEYGVQCFCGDTHPPPALLKDSSQCSMPCSGDSSTKCGGSARLSIYDTGITDIPEQGMKLGCFSDEDPRVLEGFKIDLEMTNSPRRCLNLCRSLNYQFSGVEYGVECFCGQVINANSSRDSGDEQCNATCPGDVFETCGANWELMVFRTGLSDPEPVIKRLGCFATDGSLLLKGFRQDFLQPPTPQKCGILCYNKGFLYATILSRTQCWCDNKEPTHLTSIKDENCKDTHAVVYETGRFSVPIENLSKYIGCFKDDGKVLGGLNKKFENHLTPEKCSRFCFYNGYLYSGTKNKNECLCGDKRPGSGNAEKEEDDDCNFPCSGDRSKHCGGAGKISVYSTGITDIPITGKLIGCFVDEVRPRALDGHKTDLEKTNTPRRCLNYCLQLGFKFAGLEYQKECFCGNSRPNATLSTPDSQCDSVCTGDSSQTCGGGWRMEVYRTGLDSTAATTETPPAVLTPKPEPPVCEMSETLVNGKPVCRGTMVFQDYFTASTIAGHWQHVVKIADAPDYEFVMFTSNPENSFQKDGKLILQPTLLPDKDVREGNITLEGCTGLAGTRECELSAFSYNILPPVRSARLHTQRSFNFRYGIVEIRARLPAGDWLVPELWLLPKDQSYGSNYLSGKVRVGMSRGNRYLNCNGQEVGSSTLESGVVVGTENNVTTKSVVNKISDSWHTYPHNYTLVWTPDNLSFFVDGQSQQALLPPAGRLTELLGFNTRDVPAWNFGSRIAPFDTDFYLSLGVSVGGGRDFPDGCISKDKEKPWTNFKLKAMLNFWLDKDSWKSTWDDSKSSLIVEHVKVTAL